MSLTIEVENIKCNGCASTIRNKLSQLDNVEAIDVNIETGTVTVSGENLSAQALSAELLRLGYPEKGTAEGIKAAAAKAKSFVSCAIGRLDNSE